MRKKFPLTILFIIIFSYAINAKNLDIKTPESNYQPTFTEHEISFAKNHLISQVFPAENIKNIEIKTTYETIEFSEIYGKEISIDIYGNNNTILPEINKNGNSLSIKSKILSNSKKATPGDKCKIIIYLPKEIWIDNLDIFFAPELSNPQNISKISETGSNNYEKEINNDKNFTIPEIKTRNISIETINTNITGKNLTGSIFLKTLNGNIRLENIHPEKINQKSEITRQETQIYGSSQAGNITIDNFSGYYLSLKTEQNITAKNINTDFFEIKTEDGNIAMIINCEPIATSEIITKTGNIQLFMKKDANITLNVNSLRGIFIDKIKSQRKNRPNLIKIYNNGGPSINLETVTGTIKLEDF